MNTLPLVECRAVTLRAGQRTLVADLDLAVHAGERWVVLGPNGAGKSTLLATLAGARDAQAGAVWLAGRPLEDWSVGQLAEQRALVTDRWHDPFAASVLDTVLTARFRFGVADAEGAGVARHWLREFDCEELVDRNVRRLSRGERQRVALAAALSQDSTLVLLDEPISHQDPRHQALVLDRLAAAATRRTLIASMHDMNAAGRFATHALLLTGQGAWQAGPAQEMLSAARLGTLFSTEIETLQQRDGARVFVAAGPGRDVS